MIDQLARREDGMMDVREKIKHILTGLDVFDPQVKILDEYGYRVVALVVSKSFEGMSDGDRQTLVWGKLLDELTEREQEWVEFVFTKAPSELNGSAAGSKIPVIGVNP